MILDSSKVDVEAPVPTATASVEKMDSAVDPSPATTTNSPWVMLKQMSQQPEGTAVPEILQDPSNSDDDYTYETRFRLPKITPPVWLEKFKLELLIGVVAGVTTLLILGRF